MTMRTTQLRSVFVCLVLVLGTLSMAFGQASAPFNNEWIDFSKTYYKIKVAKTGLHRITAGTLTNSGVPLVAGTSYKMYGKGQEIPLYLTTEDVLSTADYIEFYA